VLDQLREHIRAGTPVVGMEPSCLAVFKDELPKVLPHDDDAARLTDNAYHFGEFFEKFGIDVPHLEGNAVLWGHCHHRATGGVDTEQQVLERMGVQAESVEGGCCGLAGSWGFEQGKWQISMDCGEQGYLPAVRNAEPDTAIVANGFSCQTQLDDAGGSNDGSAGQDGKPRKALHLAQLMQLARSGQTSLAGSRPEDLQRPGKPAPGLARRATRTIAPLVLAGVAGLAGTAVAGRASGHASMLQRWR
jgi:Fe-S oxidoreductase